MCDGTSQIDVAVDIHVKLSHTRGFGMTLLKITASALVRLKMVKFENKFFSGSFVKYY
jgi:hypothetical protein